MSNEYAITCTHLLPLHCGGSGRLVVIDQWEIASIAPCPNCGGRLLWAENGNVPGYRICEMCGRTWMVKGSLDAKANTITVRFGVPDTSEGPEWEYSDHPDTTPEAYDNYADRVRLHGGQPHSRDTWAYYQGN